MSAPRWPDLFVVGAGRSGTTALHDFLGAHPNVRVSDHKSPNYFATGIPQPTWETQTAMTMSRRWVTGQDQYLDLFAGASAGDLLADVSPVYLQATAVAERVHAANSEARIVAILRDPADRAHAHFLGRRRDGIETTPDFGRWLDRMETSGWLDRPEPAVAFGHYVDCGRYHHFLRPYLDRFGTDRVLIVFYEDFASDNGAVIDHLLAFAGLPAHPDRARLSRNDRPNRTGEIRSPVLRRLWTASVSSRTRLRPLLPERLRRAVGRRVLADLDRTPMRPEWRARVVEVLADDIAQLEQLTGRDLSTWRA